MKGDGEKKVDHMTAQRFTVKCSKQKKTTATKTTPPPPPPPPKIKNLNKNQIKKQTTTERIVRFSELKGDWV